MTRRLLISGLMTLAAFAVTLPRPAGDLTIKTPTGPQMLSMYRGKVIVLGLLHTNCKSCQTLTTVLSRVQREYANKPVQILGAAFDPDSPLVISDWVKTWNPAFPVGVLEPEKVVSFTQVTPDMKPLPTAPMLVFIDRKGIVRSQFYGSDTFMQGDRAANIRTEIEKYLK